MIQFLNYIEVLVRKSSNAACYKIYKESKMPTKASDWVNLIASCIAAVAAALIAVFGAFHV
nr:MAG: hypothetical protein [Microviridae sp.]